MWEEVPNGWKWNVVVRKVEKHTQKCNQAYFKPFEPEQQPQNEQKGQYPEYFIFVYHNWKSVQSCIQSEFFGKETNWPQLPVRWVQN